MQRAIYIISSFVTALLLTLCTAAAQGVQQPPKYEVRAAWVTTIYGLDWPKAKATSEDGIRRQKEELLDILDRLKAANFNTVLLQTRMRGDVIYPSDLETYNETLTGREGCSPGYDPLAFAIEECHKRGMECHAWMVSIPLGTRKHINAMGRNSVVKRRPDICLTYRNEHYLNPGNPKTKEYLMELTREVITRYDLDGVHFDYLRYPERANNFPDSKEFRKYGAGKSLDDWRRDNITQIVRYIYNGVKALKPWVKVSTSPVGKLRDTSRYTSQNWNAYSVVKQEVDRWLAEGIQDQIYPMMYFRDDAFYPFVLDWHEESHGRQVVPGLGIYFLDPKEGNWKTSDIYRQIHFLRRHGLSGQAYYRTQYLTDNTQEVYDMLRDDLYATPALVPPMTWIDSIAPTPPTELTVDRQPNGYARLSWQPSADNDSSTPEPLYNVYASDSYPVDTSDARCLVAQRVRGTGYTHVRIVPWDEKRYFAVTAVDRYGNESDAATTASPQ